MVTERVIRAAAPKTPSTGLLQATPFQFYVAGEDTLALSVWSSAVATIRVAGRWYHSDTGIEPFVYTFTTNGLPSFPQTFAITPQEGYLLNCAVDVINTVVYPGQCFAQLLIGRGHGSTFIKLGTVLQGYVATSKFLAFPGSPLETSLDGAGFLVTSDIAAVGAGLNWLINGSVGRRRLIHRIAAQFNTSAVVPPRSVVLELRVNNIAIIGRIPAAGTQAASLASIYLWAPGVALSSVGNPGSFTAPLPTPCVIDDFMYMAPNVGALDVGDQWVNQRVTWEEWLTTDTIPPVAL